MGVSVSLQHRSAERQMLDAIGEAVVATDETGTVVYCNRAAEQLYGVVGHEILGRPVRGLIAPEVDDDLVAAMRSAIGAGDTWSEIVTGRRGDGSTFPHQVTLSPRYDAGRVVGMIGVGRDLTTDVAAREAALDAFAAVQVQKQRLAATLEAAGVASWDLDFATMRQTVSDNYADLLGLPFDEVPETFEEIFALVHPDDRPLFADLSPDPDAAGDRFDVEFRLVRPSGDLVWVGCKGSFVRDAAGEVIGLRGTMVNLTEQRTVEIRRVEAEARYRQTIEAANDAFVGLDADGCISEWNAAAERLFGWTVGEVLGRPLLETLVPEDLRERYGEGLAHWSEQLAAGEPLPEQWELSGLRRDGRVIAVETSMVADVDGNGTHLRAFVRDITARREHERRLAERAVTDTLTGLPNRTVLLERLDRGIGALGDGPTACAVLFIDLDGFKAVNDLRGHDAGDQLLVSVAQRLRSAVRPTDTVARIGGDEFAVVCEGLVDIDHARHVAERILAALEVPIPLGVDQHAVTASIGIASVTEPGTPPETLIKEADQAMYRAKRSGGSCYAMDEA